MIPFIWHTYTPLFKKAVLHPRHRGEPKESHFSGTVGAEGAILTIYLQLDLSNGLIRSASFTLFGPTPLVAASEALCALVEGKSCAQAARISEDLIDRQLREHKEKPAFVSALRDFLTLAKRALYEALAECPAVEGEIASPLPAHTLKGGEIDFDALTLPQKLQLIESVLDEHIRPYIELDAGGLAIKDLQGYRLIVTYEGACTSCPSAIGGTLNSIVELLRRHVHPEIEVEPDMEALSDLYADPFSL